ncbi:hypothetical protein OIV83_004888 [Microbotryomycetes sp. JL201]|nr:hypothetical protein OIV83_004888 [Microbotryomycetes sp. JL201]
MQTVKPVAGHLTNLEVLAILNAQYSARQQKVRELTGLKDQRRTRTEKEQIELEIERAQPQDLHTVSYECIKYLEREQLPTLRQDASLVDGLLEQLAKFGLTRAEQLQIVNLAPQSLVELVVCVDSFEDRFPDAEMQERMLAVIAEHLRERPDEQTTVAGRSTVPAHSAVAAGAISAMKGADEDIDMQEQDELDDMEGLIDDGTGEGALEDAGRELDEEARMAAPRVDDMTATELRAVNSSLMTEQFNWAPETFAKEGMDIANAALYAASAQLEHALRTLTRPRTTSAEDSEAVSSVVLSEDDVQKGVYRLETLLETSIDKHFDLFEIFVLRNTFNVPRDLVPYIVLDHQRAVDPAIQGKDSQSIKEYEDELAQFETEMVHERELACVLKAWQQRVAGVENVARDDGFLSGSALLDTPSPAMQTPAAEQAEPWATRSAFVNWAAHAKTSGLPNIDGESDDVGGSKPATDEVGEQSVANELAHSV